ncbi:MAG: hypothetical protein WAO00_11845 [Chthoniobacterales bacterium]
MKILLAAILSALSLQSSFGAECKLLLVPVTATLKSSGPILLDVYLLNPGRTAAMTSGVERVSIDYVVTNLTGKRLPTIGSVLETASHVTAGHLLAPHNIEHRRMSIEIPIQAGDCVELTGEISGKFAVKSNPVLVYRPEGKR